MLRNTVLAFAALAIVFAAKIQTVRAEAERLDVETIKYALKVSEEENNGFIERVIEKMHQNQISRASVTYAFAAARKRTKNQFQYFKYAVIELAKREGGSLSDTPRRRTATTNVSADTPWWERLWKKVRSLTHR